MSGTRWSARELEMLQQITTDHPPSRAPAIYNCWAGGNGFTIRSKLAIQRRIVDLQITDKASGDWVSAGYVCAVLGVSLGTTKYWTERRGIPCYRGNRKRRYFQRSVLRSVARRQPEAFAGINADRLFLLLEDRKLADSVAEQFTRRGTDPKPVKAVETGWLYPSITAAAKRMGVKAVSIYNAINHGHRSAGYHWTYA